MTQVSPLSIALWLTGVLVVALQLIDHVFDLGYMDPIISLIYFLLAQELARFFADTGLTDGDQ